MAECKRRLHGCIHGKFDAVRYLRKVHEEIAGLLARRIPRQNFDDRIDRQLRKVVQRRVRRVADEFARLGSGLDRIVVPRTTRLPTILELRSAESVRRDEDLGRIPGAKRPGGRARSETIGNGDVVRNTGARSYTATTYRRGGNDSRDRTRFSTQSGRSFELIEDSIGRRSRSSNGTRDGRRNEERETSNGQFCEKDLFLVMLATTIGKYVATRKRGDVRSPFAAYLSSSCKEITLIET